MKLTPRLIAALDALEASLSMNDEEIYMDAAADVLRAWEEAKKPPTRKHIWIGGGEMAMNSKPSFRCDLCRAVMTTENENSECPWRPTP
jgi:hypothetical protein